MQLMYIIIIIIIIKKKKKKKKMKKKKKFIGVEIFFLEFQIDVQELLKLKHIPVN